MDLLPNELIDYIVRNIGNFKDYVRFRSSSKAIRDTLIDGETNSPTLREFLIPLILDQYNELNPRLRTKFKSSIPYVAEVISVLDEVQRMGVIDDRLYESYKNSSNFVLMILEYAESIKFVYMVPATHWMTRINLEFYPRILQDFKVVRDNNELSPIVRYYNYLREVITPDVEVLALGRRGDMVDKDLRPEMNISDGCYITMGNPIFDYWFTGIVMADTVSTTIVVDGYTDFDDEPHGKWTMSENTTRTLRFDDDDEFIANDNNKYTAAATDWMTYTTLGIYPRMLNDFKIVRDDDESLPIIRYFNYMRVIATPQEELQQELQREIEQEIQRVANDEDGDDDDDEDGRPEMKITDKCFVAMDMDDNPIVGYSFTATAVEDTIRTTIIVDGYFNVNDEAPHGKWTMNENTTKTRRFDNFI